jgi:EAL domain-containing protein (putative c-di-GMP-specific phosphodiesterase class I)
MRVSKKGENTEIIKAIVALAKSLGLTKTVEGVETQDQLAQMKELDCEFGQGFLFSKPVNAAAARNILISGFESAPN